MISVITPVYNGEQFIDTCIKTVIEQQCLDVEHIIVDGGSKDRTVEIIQQYAAKHPHIRWISEKDRGQSDAMNKGIAMAKGHILAFLNVDDYYEPNALNRVLELFKNLPEPCLLAGNCNIWDSRDHIRFVNQPKNLKFTELLLGPAVNPFPLNPSAYFYHASLHKTIGFYDINEHYTLDVDFLLRAVQVATPVYVDEILGNHLQIEGTKTFHDIRNGTNSDRVDRLMKLHRQSLAIPQRWLIGLGYEFFKAIDWPKYKYFLEQPENIWKSLRKKAQLVLGW